MTPQEIAALFAAAEKQKADDAIRWPDTYAVLSAISGAAQRLRDLGWRDAYYCPKDGTTFAMAQAGSTGIFSAFYTGKWPDGYIIADDCFYGTGGCWWKPLDKLTDDERVILERCDKSTTAHIERMAAILEQQNDT